MPEELDKIMYLKDLKRQHLVNPELMLTAVFMIIVIIIIIILTLSVDVCHQSLPSQATVHGASVILICSPFETVTSPMMLSN